jgi:hypothetical protein
MFAEFHLVSYDVNALVHVEHELMKMNAALADDRAAFEKEIHQHRLAAADFTVQVNAFERRQRALAAGKQPAQRLRFMCQRAIGDSGFEPRHFFDDSHLRLVALDAPSGDSCGVTRCDRARHQSSAIKWRLVRVGINVLGERLCVRWRVSFSASAAHELLCLRRGRRHGR